MALLHRTTLSPTKLELLTAWLPGRSWYQGQVTRGDLVRVASCRFDDPAGAVGIETMLVSAGDGPTYHVPLTYRGAPLDGSDNWLVGTTDHGVLGRRWVYDACGDPVYAATLAGAILAGTGQAEEFFETGGRREPHPPSLTVSSVNAPVSASVTVDSPLRVLDGDPTRIVTDTVELIVVRRPGARAPLPGPALVGTWSGQPTPLPLAYALPR
jgi:hypothetical protein